MLRKSMYVFTGKIAAWSDGQNKFASLEWWLKIYAIFVLGP